MATIRKFLLTIALCCFFSAGNSFKVPGRHVSASDAHPLPLSASSLNEKDDFNVIKAVRGGDVAFSKASVVRLHGFVAAAFGALFLVESSGMIKIPLIGPSAAIGGFDTGNAAMMFVTRFLGSLMIGLGLLEQNVYADPVVHKIYDQYHVLAVVGLWISSKVRIHLLYLNSLSLNRNRLKVCSFVLTSH